MDEITSQCIHQRGVIIIITIIIIAIVIVVGFIVGGIQEYLLFLPMLDRLNEFPTGQTERFEAVYRSELIEWEYVLYIYPVNNNLLAEYLRKADIYRGRMAERLIKDRRKDGKKKNNINKALPWAEGHWNGLPVVIHLGQLREIHPSDQYRYIPSRWEMVRIVYLAVLSLVMQQGKSSCYCYCYCYCYSYRCCCWYSWMRKPAFSLQIPSCCHITWRWSIRFVQRGCIDEPILSSLPPGI